MKSLPECAFCDKEWYHKGFTADDIDDNVFLIHDRIPLATAEALRIPSLISRTLGVETLDIGYGQSEPLTRRLKTILRDYSDGLSVLKELIQNADDAGAKEIRFVYDERSNSDAVDILLDQNMKSLQGPALWTYNDAVFTDEDFDNIVKLSGATKENSGDKIGRFGLGFNAVYNLTDVPSFVSRHSIVFFDPHMSYLGRALQGTSKPGIRLNLKTHRPEYSVWSISLSPTTDSSDAISAETL
jgi:sacsin